MRCARCQGCVVAHYDEVRCLNCGHRPLAPAPREPEPHGLCKPKLGDLTHCACGQEKVEWRKQCKDCSGKKLRQEQRRQHRRKQDAKAKQVAA